MAVWEDPAGGLSGKSVDLGAQLAYDGTGWPTWRVRARDRLSPRGVQEVSGSRPGLAASPRPPRSKAPRLPDFTSSAAMHKHAAWPAGRRAVTAAANQGDDGESS
jgi:hypothetical protein